MANEESQENANITPGRDILMPCLEPGHCDMFLAWYINKCGNWVALLSVILIATSYIKQTMWKYTEIDQTTMLTIMYFELVSRRSCLEASLKVPGSFWKKKSIKINNFHGTSLAIHLEH